VVLLSIPAGAALAGIAGMFLIVPVLAVIQTTFQSVVLLLGDKPAAPPAPPAPAESADEAGDHRRVGHVARARRRGGRRAAGTEAGGLRRGRAASGRFARIRARTSTKEPASTRGRER